MPTFIGMTVKRKPLWSFSQFSRLPIEIQSMVRDFAASGYPRVVSMSSDDGHHTFEPEYDPQRGLAIEHTCQASRYAIWKGLDLSLRRTHVLNLHRDHTKDVVLLKTETENFKDFAKEGLKSIAILWGGGTITAADLKAFPKLERLVILIGKQRARCAMTIVPFEENPLSKWTVKEMQTIYRPVAFAEELRQDL